MSDASAHVVPRRLDAWLSNALTGVRCDQRRVSLSASIRVRCCSVMSSGVGRQVSPNNPGLQCSALQSAPA
jgi:hypothetical protein